MTPKPIYIVDIFGDIVTKVENVLLSALQAADPTIEGINYLYDAPIPMMNTLVDMTKSGAKKYPLVGLFLPAKERHGSQIGIDDIPLLRIIIGRFSNPTDTTPQRYTNNFKPFLYPIYTEFIHQIDCDRRFLTQGAQMIQHDKTDWPYWGGDSLPGAANPFGDWLDIIEISNLQVKLNLKNC
jgi:hypothetical protein